MDDIESLHGAVRTFDGAAKGLAQADGRQREKHSE
jgi:hypothetical protein